MADAASSPHVKRRYYQSGRQRPNSRCPACRPGRACTIIFNGTTACASRSLACRAASGLARLGALAEIWDGALHGIQPSETLRRSSKGALPQRVDSRARNDQRHAAFPSGVDSCVHRTKRSGSGERSRVMSAENTIPPPKENARPGEGTSGFGELPQTATHTGVIQAPESPLSAFSFASRGRYECGQ